MSTNIIIKRIIITPLSCTLALVNRADADGDVDCDGSCDTPPSVALNAHISRTCSHASTQSAILPLSPSLFFDFVLHCLALLCCFRSSSFTQALSVSFFLTLSCTAFTLHCFQSQSLSLSLSLTSSCWLIVFLLPSLCTALLLPFTHVLPQVL